MTTVRDRPIRSQYEDYLRCVWEKGLEKTGRNGVTKSIFGPPQMRFDLSEGFPLVTTKKVFLKAIIVELLWFLNGGRNVQQLHEHSVTIWDEWAREDGDLGPIYGFQWRGWPNWVEEPAHYEGTEWVEARMVNKPIDQIAQVVQQLRSDPDSRRILVSSWNVADLDQMALMPCHAMFQWYVSPELGPNGKRKLSCQLYQRSADSFLGVPFNIASYALLTMMMAQQCDLDVGDFIWVGGDCHIYDKHYEQVTIQLGRAPYPYPTLHIKRRPASIFDYELDDFEVLDYQYHPRILGEVSK